MAPRGKIQRRLAAAIVLTALIPVLGAVWLARSMVQQTSERFFLPEIGVRLDESLGLYKELAQMQKASMRHQAAAIAAHQPLRAAAAQRDGTAALRELKLLIPRYPELASARVEDADGRVLASVDRGRPVDSAKEYELLVHSPLAGGESEEPAVLFTVFTTDRARFERLEHMSQFVDTYAKIAERRKQDDQTYVLAFAVLLGFTIILAIGVGTLLARGVSTRIAKLASATKQVGAGDLKTRVDETGVDEIGDLARAFNRMLVEVETSRARVEYLERIGAWQEMARRLAHEIKNPLTPIQLAVEEVHERYEGPGGPYKKLLDTTLEVVQAEVGTLRRLVTEFSDFARLPQALLEREDLAAFLREQSDQVRLLTDDWTRALSQGDGAKQAAVQVTFELPDVPAPALLDRQMLRRAVINLVHNSAQAAWGAGREQARVNVRLSREGDYWIVDVDDDGPGIVPELRARVFDPYVTTKADGTGLGLAIAKKVIIEHGGSIDALESPLGGARLRVRLPAAGSPAGAETPPTGPTLAVSSPPALARGADT